MSEEGTEAIPVSLENRDGSEHEIKGDNHEAFMLPDFATPDHFSDITLVVEDKPIHAHKTILSLASPVWMAMFSSDFKEKRVDFVDLPGKTHSDMIDLLQFVYPPCKKAVQEENVYKVLPLSDEYQIQWLKDACEDFLVDRIMQEVSSEHARDTSEFARFCVEHIYLGQLYSLDRMFTMAVNIAAELPFSAVKSADMFSSLGAKTLTVMYEKRDEMCHGKINLLEKQLDENKTATSAVQQKCSEIANNALKIKRMGTYVRPCLAADDSVCCACDSCIYFGRYFERIISEYQYSKDL